MDSGEGHRKRRRRDSSNVQNYYDKSLEELDEYAREKELARRYDEKLKIRQREELLGREKFSNETYNDVDHLEASETWRGNSSWEEDPQQQHTASGSLFAEDNGPSQGTLSKNMIRHDKKLTKALAALSSQLLESIRLSTHNIKEMQDHPQIASYLRGCLVRIPNLFKVETSSWGAGSPQNVLARIVALAVSNKDQTTADLFDLIVMPIGLDITEHVSVGSIVDETISDEDVEDIRNILRTSASMYDLAISFHHSATEKAKQLCQFTFTEADVNEILQRKRYQSSAHSKDHSGIPSARLYRNCYQQQADVSAQVEQVKLKLQDLGLSPSERREYTNRLRELELELHELTRQISHFRTSSASVSSLNANSSYTIATNRSASSIFSPERSWSSLLISGGGRSSHLSHSRSSSFSSTFERSGGFLYRPQRAFPNTIVTPFRQGAQFGPTVLMRILEASQQQTSHSSSSSSLEPASSFISSPSNLVSASCKDIPLERHLSVLRTLLDCYNTEINEQDIDSFVDVHSQNTRYPALLHTWPPLSVVSEFSKCDLENSVTFMNHINKQHHNQQLPAVQAIKETKNE